jgi:hypothetical protein
MVYALHCPICIGASANGLPTTYAAAMAAAVQLRKLLYTSLPMPMLVVHALCLAVGRALVRVSATC